MANKLTVIGISRSKGDFNGQAYDNIYFHCTKPSDMSKGQQGELCEIIKVKASNVEILPDINSFITPVYNRFGQVECILIF